MSLIFVMIKPWTTDQAGSILHALDSAGTRLAEASIDALPLERIAQQYHASRHEAHYAAMLKDLEGKPAHLAIYDADPVRMASLKEDLRLRYDPFIPPHPFHKRNALHTTESQEEFDREFALFQDYFPSDISRLAE